MFHGKANATGVNIMWNTDNKKTREDNGLMQPPKADNANAYVGSGVPPVHGGENVVLQPSMSKNLVLQCHVKTDKCLMLLSPLVHLHFPEQVVWCCRVLEVGAQLIGMVRPRG